VVEVHLRGATKAVAEECVKVFVPGPGVDGDDLQGRRPVTDACAAGIRADRCPDGGDGKTACIEDDGVAPVDRADCSVERGAAVPVGSRVKPTARREPLNKSSGAHSRILPATRRIASW